MKRICLILSIAALIGIFIRVFKSRSVVDHRSPGSGQVEKRKGPDHDGAAGSASPSSAAGVPESQRHAGKEIEKHLSNRSTLVELEESVKAQDKKLEKLRKELITIFQTPWAVVYQESSKSGMDFSSNPTRQAFEIYNYLQMDRIKTDTQINSLMKYKGDQLVAYAAAMDRPESPIKDLYSRYLSATLLQKESDQRVDHMDTNTLTKQVNVLKHQLDDGISDFKALLQEHLEMTDGLLKSGSTEIIPPEETKRRSLAAHNYSEAKRNLENEQARLNELRGQLDGEKQRLKNEKR